MLERVLITRPKDAATYTLAAIKAAGFNVWHQPCLTIVPIARDSSQGQMNKRHVLALDEFAHIIVISANAAHCLLSWVDEYWPQWPVGQTIWAMGEATKKRLQTGLVPCIKQSDPHHAMPQTSEALLEKILPVVTPHDKVLIVKGEGGRETLAQALQPKVDKVSFIQGYQRQKPTLSSLQIKAVMDFNPEVVVVQSEDTLRNFHQLLGQYFTVKPALVVPSHRVQAAAQKLKYEHCWLSQGASDAAICDTLVHYQQLAFI